MMDDDNIKNHFQEQFLSKHIYLSSEIKWFMKITSICFFAPHHSHHVLLYIQITSSNTSSSNYIFSFRSTTHYYNTSWHKNDWKNLKIKKNNLYLFYLFMLTMRQTYLAFNFLCRRARYIDLRLYTLQTPITGMTLIFFILSNFLFNVIIFQYL